eukprot:g2434.t1
MASTKIGMCGSKEGLEKAKGNVDRNVSAGKGTAAVTRENLSAVVRREVERVNVIDLHTHLFPPSHGDLLLWGIDDLLTYHYLVSEAFMVFPGSITHESFFAMSKSEQADLIWEHLFRKRSPLSEAQIGVLTTLKRFGLDDLVERGDLPAVRKWFREQDPSENAEKVFQVAKCKYVVMTNIPFLERETCKWVKSSTSKIDLNTASFASSEVLEQTYDRKRFRTALRIDPLLSGDWKTIAACLDARGLPQTLAGTRAFLEAWAKVYRPEYLMASTPKLFGYRDTDPGPKGEGWPSATELIEKVMIPVARKLNLPLAMKFGACRGMQPGLDPCGGGDGCVVADIEPLKQMCVNFPDVKFLATFLSRVNQHEVAVVSQKMRNLHIYGCWWFCNNPSMIEEITRMRLELLGTAFTSQHSDARIMDQLVYKWAHSRRVIGDALVEQYRQLASTGWTLTEAAISKDIERLFGGSYEEFMAKKL